MKFIAQTVDFLWIFHEVIPSNCYMAVSPVKGLTGVHWVNRGSLWGGGGGRGGGGAVHELCVFHY